MEVDVDHCVSICVGEPRTLVLWLFAINATTGRTFLARTITDIPKVVDRHFACRSSNSSAADRNSGRLFLICSEASLLPMSARLAGLRQVPLPYRNRNEGGTVKCCVVIRLRHGLIGHLTSIVPIAEVCLLIPIPPQFCTKIVGRRCVGR
ncbi:hypothetical protein Fuma_03952 [Fuerstiella marisgermanici]|uniref:Uncharacterized protein n=1 Tax=Fuerstiella marisgermanici TaxID=1891926 RepID=A0A1P8WJU2_9PLAN|nr:hypothetical protein Fuma_03952 [Fuerstiella marisgermanici]